MRRAPACGTMLAAVVLGTAALSAHDFWIEPATFQPKLRDSVPLRLRVGSPASSLPYQRDPRHLRWFLARAGDNVGNVPGSPGDDPAGRLYVQDAGLILVGYRSFPTTITLPTAVFEGYLSDERLDGIRRRRAAQGKTGLVVTEAFARNAKALLRVGGGPAGGFDRRLHLPLELVPERDPYSMAPGEALPVLVLLAGVPLGDAPVTAIPLLKPDRRTVLRTDGAGRVELHLATPGPWLIKTINSEPARAAGGPDYFTEWASLTFELPRKGAAP